MDADLKNLILGVFEPQSSRMQYAGDSTYMFELEKSTLLPIKTLLSAFLGLMNKLVKNEKMLQRWMPT